MAPSEGKVKCNIGAAFFKESNSMGIGVCLRGHHGKFLHAKTHDFELLSLGSRRGGFRFNGSY